MAEQLKIGDVLQSLNVTIGSAFDKGGLTQDVMHVVVTDAGLAQKNLLLSRKYGVLPGGIPGTKMMTSSDLETFLQEQESNE